MGVPEEHARVYSDRLSRGDYLVIIDGTGEDIRRAETILRNRDIQEFNIFSSPDIAGTPTNSPASSVENNSQVIIIDHRNPTI